MKATKLLLTAVVMAATSMTAFAQFVSGGGVSNVTSTSSNEDYNRFTVSYVMGSFDYDGIKSKDDINEPNGVSIGLTHGQSISSNTPLFLEYGVTLTWLNGSEDDDVEELSRNILDISVPVNLAYKVNVSDEFSIVPYIGPSARLNIMSKATLEDSYESVSIDFFDKDDVGKESVWNRFQIGAQVGIGVSFNNYYFSYQYQWDFMDLAKKMTMTRNMISVGFNF